MLKYPFFLGFFSAALLSAVLFSVPSFAQSLDGAKDAPGMLLELHCGEEDGKWLPGTLQFGDLPDAEKGDGASDQVDPNCALV